MVALPTRYDATPHYPCVGGAPTRGWAALVASLPAGPFVLAVDGPAVLDWESLVAALTAALTDRGTPVDVLDVRAHVADWATITGRTAPVDELRDDPDFATLARGSLELLFDERPSVDRSAERTVLVVGPGAGLVEHDLLWYADLPKRFAEAAVAVGTGSNLGAPPHVESTTRRLFYIDWPLLDAHRDRLAPRVAQWVDLQVPGAPTGLDGDTLRATLARLAGQPFRTRPTFNTSPWGGHWAQRELDVNPDARNTALGYELIAPESGILLGEPEHGLVEIPFQLLAALHPTEMLGVEVHGVFGTSFPIRFDYLDTMDGGNLSVHCHPQADYMREIFGWPYTQHETYYIMCNSPDSLVYLGLRDDTGVEEFAKRAHDAATSGVSFDIEKFVQTFPAEAHQLFLVPAGTPHGSGVGNVVLEISATPYLYSLRFYDWLRRDADGSQRPVHVEHAFRNLDQRRSGRAVAAELVPRPGRQDDGADWHDELLGRLPAMFFEVHRLVLQPGAEAARQTADRFHVLNVVAGTGAVISWRGGTHALAYAETMVVPAAVGSYTVTAAGSEQVRIVWAVVR